MRNQQVSSNYSSRVNRLTIFTLAFSELSSNDYFLTRTRTRYREEKDFRRGNAPRSTLTPDRPVTRRRSYRAAVDGHFRPHLKMEVVYIGTLLLHPTLFNFFLELMYASGDLVA